MVCNPYDIIYSVFSFSSKYKSNWNAYKDALFKFSSYDLIVSYKKFTYLGRSMLLNACKIDFKAW